MIARWLSVAFHPFVMVGIMVGTAAAARQTAGDAVRSVAIVALFTVIPLFILMVRQVRRGAWDNVDASNRGERPILYFVGGAAVIALLVYVVVTAAGFPGTGCGGDAGHARCVRSGHPVGQSLAAYGICRVCRDGARDDAIASGLPADFGVAGALVGASRASATHAA